MRGLPNTKSVTANGKRYLYFVTGRMNAKGRPILSRLPEMTDPTFGAVYAAHMGALSKSKQIETVLNVPALIRLYEKSPKFIALSAGTQRIYGIYLKKFAEGFATAPAAEIARRDVLQIADALKPAAANTFVKTVASLYAWGRRRGHVENDPCKDIDMNEIGEHDPWPQELLDAGLASEDNDLRLAVHLLFYTAQRIGDVCAMRWTDIAGNVIRVTQEKTGRQLEIRIHSALATELARHPRSLSTILTWHGKPLKTPTLRLRIKTFAKELGEKVVPHGLRKNAVNALLEVGCSVAETAAISGQSLAMVEHYAKKRAQAALGTAAILKWERAQNANVQK
jgi:integrase